MEDPNFPVTITVGGTGQSYKFSAFPKEMHANQSFILTATIQKEGGSAYDLSSASATLYVSGWKNSISPVTLVGGVIVSNTITFTVPKDLIPESLGGLPLRNPGNSVFYFIVEDTDSILQFFQPVNVLDTNYTLSGEVDSSPNVITPDKNDFGTVIQVNLNTPPGSPTFEDAYIVGTSPTGDWVGQNNNLAVYNGSSWVFYDTVDGNFVFDHNSNQQQIFNGTTWGPTAAVTYSDGESINDNNGNELIQFGVVGSAVNEVKITNAATGNGPIIAPAGETNIDLNVNATGTGVIKAGSTLLTSKGADVASAGALTLGTDGNYFDITGTTTITSIATLGIGTQVTLHFDGILTLTHHATDLILPSGANITTAAGDEFTFVEYASGDWRCIGYVLASGAAIAGDVVGPASSTDNALARFDSTTGKLVQNGTITQDDSGNLASVGKIDTGTEVAIGQNAGDSTQGTSAVAVGEQAGQISQGAYGIAMGQQAGETSQGDYGISMGRQAGQISQGAYGIAMGYLAGNDTQGSYGIAMGRLAGATTQGDYSVALGYLSGLTTQGSNAVAIGQNAGATSQGDNGIAMGYLAGATSQGSTAVAIGQSAGQTSQSSNTVAIGYQAGQTSLGSNCTAVGYRTLTATTGSNNTSVGHDAGRLTTTGSQNVALGAFSLDANTTASSNTAIGYAALSSSTSSENTACGTLAMSGITTGASNIGIGQNAGRYISGGVTVNQTSGTSCYFGANTKAGADGNTNETVIGYNTTGNGSNTVTIGNSSITETWLQGALVIEDGITAPGTITGRASIYVDTSDGDLKIKLADGTVKTILTHS